MGFTLKKRGSRRRKEYLAMGRPSGASSTSTTCVSWFELHHGASASGAFSCWSTCEHSNWGFPSISEKSYFLLAWAMPRNCEFLAIHSICVCFSLVSFTVTPQRLKMQKLWKWRAAWRAKAQSCLSKHFIPKSSFTTAMRELANQ